MLSPVIRTFLLALTASLCVVAVASATTTGVSLRDAPTSNAAAFTPGAQPTASIKLRTCRSAAYYDNRLIAYRIRMERFSDTNAPQKLQMRVDVWQRFDGAKKYRRVKAEGLHVWTSSSDSATIYQRDLLLTNVETAARFKARVSMRWVGANGVEWRRTLRSKVCRQKKGLPRLSVTSATAVPAADSTDMVHTVTVANRGRSEAVDVPVAVVVDGGAPVVARVDSIGPRQTDDVVIRAPACAARAYAQIDPLRELVRLRSPARRQFALVNCA